MKLFYVYVPGRPRPASKGKGGITYLSKAGRRHKKQLIDFIRYNAEEMSRREGMELPLVQPVQVWVRYSFGNIGGTSIGLSIPEDDEKFHVKRPDIDNLNAMVLGAIDESGILADDAQVAWLDSMKKVVK